MSLISLTGNDACVPIALATWWFMHESGVPATIAGVALALLTRVRRDSDEQDAPAVRLEHRLQSFSAGVAVPVFALFAMTVSMRAGVALEDPTRLLGGVGLSLVARPWKSNRFTEEP